MPDRIEAGTFLAAAAATGGSVALRGTRPDTLGAVLEKLGEAGATIEVDGDVDPCHRGAAALAAITLRTAPYPAFPTDMQAQFMALMTIAGGASVITETIFENRIHARAGTQAPGRRHRGRGQHRDRQGRCRG